MPSSPGPSPSGHFALVCEAGSIASYVTASNRLRHIAGASEVIEQIWERVLPAVLDTVTSENIIDFPRRAGGAFYATCTDAATLARFQALFSLAANQHAPDLILQFGWGQGATPLAAYDAAIRDSARSRSQQTPGVPLAGPFTERDARTGRAAAGASASPGRAPIDLPCLRFEAAMERFGRSPPDPQSRTLASKFLPANTDGSRYVWPTVFEADDAASAQTEFPWTGERHALGVIYADGSGMAKISRRVREVIKGLEARDPAAFGNIFSEFSRAMDGAMLAAAAQATQDVLLAHANAKNVLPARPIVLGGDDVAIAVRADLALSYTRKLLATFELKSGEALRQLQQRFRQLQEVEFPPHLTAGAGIVYAKSSQPYSRLHELAQDLCTKAKDIAKAAVGAAPTPSVLGWHRLTTAVIEDAGTIRSRELCLRDPSYASVMGSGDASQPPALHLTLPAYALASAASLPTLGTLLALRDWVAKEPGRRSGLRRLVTLLARDPYQAQRHYKRWCEQHAPPDAEFHPHLLALAGNHPVSKVLPFWRDAGGEYHSPLADVLALLAIDGPTAANQEERA